MVRARVEALILLVLGLGAAPLCAGTSDQFGGFQEFVDRGSLKPFTRDLGSVLGAASFHSGRSLGFSGFDMGVRGGVQLRPSKGNEVLGRRGVKTFGLPWVQAEIGLPFRLDGYIRGVSFQGLTIAGGGLRWQIRQAVDTPLTPHFLLATVAHSVTHQQFAASHFGANFITSLGVPAATGYIGAGVDRTRVVVRSVPVQDPTLVGEVATTLESRFTAGVSFRPYKFVYLHGAYTLTHGMSGFDSGVGVRF